MDANDGAPRPADRLAAALGALDDPSLRRAVAALREPSRAEIADELRLPRAAMHLGDALVPLLRRKLQAAPPARRLSVAFTLTEPVNTDTIAALGPRHEDPSREDMLEVLPAMIERHGTPLVVLMLTSYAASDARCQGVFADLLDTDDRFALGDATLAADPSADATANAVAGPHGGQEDPDRDGRRAQRKAAKEARRAAEARRRAAREAAEAKRRHARRAAKHARHDP